MAPKPGGVLVCGIALLMGQISHCACASVLPKPSPLVPDPVKGAAKHPVARVSLGFSPSPFCQSPGLRKSSL